MKIVGHTRILKNNKWNYYGWFLWVVVNKGLKLRIFPDEYMTHVLEQNIGNARFIWNNMLSMYVNLYMLFRFHGCPLYPNIRNFNAMLKILKQENVFFFT